MQPMNGNPVIISWDLFCIDNVIPGQTENNKISGDPMVVNRNRLAFVCYPGDPIEVDALKVKLEIFYTSRFTY
jgi:hypothetical protein